VTGGHQFNHRDPLRVQHPEPAGPGCWSPGYPHKISPTAGPHIAPGGGRQALPSWNGEYDPFGGAQFLLYFGRAGLHCQQAGDTRKAIAVIGDGSMRRAWPMGDEQRAAGNRLSSSER
jgi:hypothetical protein